MSEHIGEKESAQHHSTTSQKHGYTNSYSLKPMEILTQKFQILFQGEYARKWNKCNVFFHVLNHDVFTRNIQTIIMNLSPKPLTN